MGEESKIGGYEPVDSENRILDYWKSKKIYAQAKKKVAKGKIFYFLDGPPYTSGKVHVGTAWNKALKDMVLRYKRMAGMNVWDRAGYDMHGLPTEHATEKKLGIHGREEIEKFGVNKFIEECRKLCVENMNLMNRDFQRMGVWMDFDNAYQSITPEFIEGEWWLVKKAHENGRLYEGLRTITWCANDGTALAKHELEYETVKDESIYLKFKIEGTKNEYLIIWTTTPWTIPFNLAVMVNPEVDYVKAKVDDEIWVVAKALTSFIPATANRKFEIVEEFKGKKLEGIKYHHPFEPDIQYFKDNEKKVPKMHTVILSEEYVDTSAGSGLVHCAPGCGPEDYEIGHRNGIPPFNELDEHGIFKKSMGKFAGMRAKVDDAKFVDALEKNGTLIATSPIEHEYAHCSRCHNPVVFRTTKQWFFKIEDLKEKMREFNRAVLWVPDYAGSRQFDSWLANLRDNSISRQRYWGTPLPIWKCGCGNYEVIGSREELKKKTGKLPEDLHLQNLNGLTIKCSKCKKEMHRVPDVLDVWVDAGSASWNCLNYPQDDKLFKKLFPADFILEGIDQVRGWFNILCVASMVAFQKPSFKAAYMHGFINDSLGRKMSKSLKNYILPEEVIEKYGADTMRYYMIGATKPGLDMSYNFEDMKLKFRNLSVLWNVHKFLIDYSDTIENADTKIAAKNLSIEEKYILSVLNSTILKVTELYENYRLNEVPEAIEFLFLELSRTYIQMIREKSVSGSEEEKQTVFAVIYTVLFETIKMLSTVAPFISEQIYLNLKNKFGLKTASVTLQKWPSAEKKYIDEELEKNMGVAKEILQAIYSAREASQLGIRWPVKDVIVATKEDNAKNAVKKLGDTIKTLANVKEIIIKEDLGLRKKVRADYKKLGPVFGEKTPKVIAQLSINSPETILGAIEREGKFSFRIDNEKVEVRTEHLLIESELPSHLVEAKFRGGSIYLNKDRNKELDSEGYAREVTRRVQELRKKSGMVKTGKIELFVKTKVDIKHWAKQIKDKVGAVRIDIDSDTSENYEHESKEKIKGEEFVIMMNKV